MMRIRRCTRASKTYSRYANTFEWASIDRKFGEEAESEWGPDHIKLRLQKEQNPENQRGEQLVSEQALSCQVYGSWCSKAREDPLWCKCFFFKALSRWINTNSLHRTTLMGKRDWIHWFTSSSGRLAPQATWATLGWIQWMPLIRVYLQFINLTLPSWRVPMMEVLLWDTHPG